MEIATGTGVGPSLSAARKWRNRNKVSKHPLAKVDYFVSKNASLRTFFHFFSRLILLSYCIYMPGAAATTNCLVEGRHKPDCDIKVQQGELRPGSSPVIVPNSIYSGSLFTRRSLAGIYAAQRLIEGVKDQTIPGASQDARLAQRDLSLNPETSLTQSVKVAPSQTVPVGFTTTHTGISPSETAWPLPTPFDVGFSHNITTACQKFMNDMLGSATFKQCSPISMLLQNSNSFFQASKHLVRITSLLDSSCGAPVNICTDLLHSYAQNLTNPSACAPDLLHSNPQIESALLGLSSYRTLYTASCLRASSSIGGPSKKNNIHSTSLTAPSSSGGTEDSYCFANALTNTTNPTNSYIYFLPLNVSLVGSAVPTCNNCLQSTMTVFQQATANRSGVLAHNYLNAANQVNVVCGPEFVNASLVAAISSASGKAFPRSSIHTVFWIWSILIIIGSTV